ncbi:uncharacterized protein LOC112169057 isoform X2 [Rosa chinensis]|uniref:uncharacterized protein LOC112169057 isoform X2 n=1 Tax=Rosa chinensis TaxID=74649 RepID=UPI000D08FA98|nr:uncharacterized protein LOC112169057 isoform X2 [Rosa chinensis]
MDLETAINLAMELKMGRNYILIQKGFQSLQLRFLHTNWTGLYALLLPITWLSKRAGSVKHVTPIWLQRRSSGKACGDRAPTYSSGRCPAWSSGRCPAWSSGRCPAWSSGRCPAWYFCSFVFTLVWHR